MMDILNTIQSLPLLVIAGLVLGATKVSASVINGKATYYGGNENGGACGYNDLPYASFPYGYSAATGSTLFDDGYGCGACYLITCVGPYGNNPGCHCSSTTPSVVVQATDQCPECSDTHFDLNTNAMQRIVGAGLAGTCGVIEVTIEQVNCDFTTNIKIRSKSGTSAYWYGLHVDDVAGYGSLSLVQLKNAGSANFDITCLKGQGPSFWICDNAPYTFPLSVKLTDKNGDILYGNDIIGNGNGNTEWDFGSNFPSMSNSPSNPISNPTSNPTPLPAPTVAPLPDQLAMTSAEDGCFSSHMKVNVLGKGSIMMKDLVVRDKVLTGSGIYMPVYTIDHFDHFQPTQFIQMHTTSEQSPLEVTSNHMIFIEGKSYPVPASRVNVGDSIQSIKGPTKVTKIETVIRNGLYNPVTTDGTIVVNGIIASTYTSHSGSSHLDISGIQFLSVHTVVDMVSTSYGAFCMSVSLDLCNQHVELSGASIVLRYLNEFWLQQNDMIKVVVLLVYILMFGCVGLLLRYYIMGVLLFSVLHCCIKYKQNSLAKITNMSIKGEDRKASF